MDPELALYLGLLGADVISSGEQISKGPGREGNPVVHRITGTDKPSSEQFASIGGGLALAALMGWELLPEWAPPLLIAIEGGAAAKNTVDRNTGGDNGGAFLLGALGAEGLRRLLKDDENVSAGPAAPLGAPGVGVTVKF